MRTFDELVEMAVEYRGNEDEVLSLMPPLLSISEIASIGDDRILSAMSQAVFQAGFSWRVINNKWPGFEESFEGFVPVRWKFMSDDDFDTLIKDTKIVRHATKILSVRDNAIMLCDLEDEYGSAAKCIAEWPQDDFIGLLELLKKRGSRLGGNSGAYFLRSIGRDGWVLSRDVVQALIRDGVIDKTPTSKTAMRAVQAAFSKCAEESGRPFAHISRALALSVGPNI